LDDCLQLSGRGIKSWVTKPIRKSRADTKPSDTT
jgi:hypothetical protein